MKEGSRVTACTSAKIGGSCCVPGSAVFLAMSCTQLRKGQLCLDVWAVDETQGFLGRETSNQSLHFPLWEHVKLSSVQSLSRVWLFATPWTSTHQASLSITNSWSLLKCVSIESVMPSNHLILCSPLLLLPSVFPQHQGLFQWVSYSHIQFSSVQSAFIKKKKKKERFQKLNDNFLAMKLMLGMC